MSLTRDFLEQQGLESDVITAIMKEHGKTVQPLNEKVEQLETANTQLETQVSERDNQLAELKQSGDDELKQRITDLEQANAELKQVHADELQTTIKRHKIELLAKGIGTNDEEWATDKLAKLELKDGELVGADELVSELKEKHPTLFAVETEPEQIKKWSQGNSTVSGQSTVTREQFDAMNITEKSQVLVDNPDFLNNI